MGISVSLTASTEPVTLTEIKAHCRIDTDADDTYLGDIIEAARRQVESITGRQIMDATYTVKFDRFPTDDYIELPGAPLQTVTSVSYVNTSGTTTTFSSASYDVDATATPGRIYVDRGVGWPSTYDERNAVTIVYKAGYSTAGAVPEDIKHAIRFLAANWYEMREPVISGTAATPVPATLTWLMDNLKIRGTLNIAKYGLYG